MKVTRRTALAGAGAGLAAQMFPAGAARAVDVTTDTDGLGFQFGDPIRPFNKCPWLCQRRPTGVALDPKDNGAVGAEFASQAAQTPPYVNIDGRYSGEPYTTPAGVALVPVTVAKGGYHIIAQMKLGFPFPKGATPASSGEPTLSSYQPERVGKYNRPGFLYELYKWSITSTDASGNPTALAAEDAARYTGVNADTVGHGYTWVGGPGAAAYGSDIDSTYTDQNYITAASLPYSSLVVSLPDVQRGFIDHAIGISVIRSYGRVWPAQRSDGSAVGNILHEGDRVILDLADVNTAVHPLNLLCQMALVNFCGVIDDGSGSIGVRFAPSVATFGYTGGAHLYDILKGFPWSKLRRIGRGNADGTVFYGSDTDQVPVTP